MPNRSKYALMSTKDKNIVMFISFISAVVFFDFLIYLYIADVVSAAIFPANTDPNVAKLQGMGLFVIGYLARPIGGIIFGRYGDIKGRKTTQQMMLCQHLLPLVINCRKRKKQ